MGRSIYLHCRSISRHGNRRGLSTARLVAAKRFIADNALAFKKAELCGLALRHALRGGEDVCLEPNFQKGIT